MPDTFSSYTSNGLLPGDGYTLESTGYSSLATAGGGLVLTGNDIPASNITPTSVASSSANYIPTAVNGLASINDMYGNVIVPTASGYESVGSNGVSMPVSSNVINSLLAGNTALSNVISDANRQSFSGTDLKIMIECASNTSSSNGGTTYKQLLECSTLSISSYRVKNPVRSLGYTNPKSFSRGPRTIAGTMVITEMSVDVLLTFLQSIVINDTSKNSNIVKTDQLPPFNITLVFANEEGAASYRRLLGVEFVNDGTVYSVQDQIIERTISWVAEDFTPLLPMDTSTLFSQNILSGNTIPAESTPADFMSSSTPGGSTS